MEETIFDILETLKEETLDISTLSPRVQHKVLLDNQGDPRLSKVDLIWTQTRVWCCQAVIAGWEYGFRSGHGYCKYAETERTAAHYPVFVDNDYENYVHRVHLAAVKQFRPRYATVRDIMSKEQCQEAGISYFSMDRIMDWAEELSEYSDNVIIIPKIPVIDKIPEKYILGYSVPTSYGGTPLPTEAFKGRRVHLLGGSPNRQIAYWSKLKDEVVSIDNNYIHKMGVKGNLWLLDGRSVSLNQLNEEKNARLGIPPSVIGFGDMQNIINVCVAISLGNFATYWRRKAISQEELLDQMEVIV